VSVDVIGIFSSDAAPISNVRYENIRIEDPRVMALVEIRTHPMYTTADEAMGTVRGVVFKNVDVTMPSPIFSAIYADKAEIADVTFDNFRINGTPMRSAEQMKLLLRGDTKNIRFLPRSK